MVKHLLRDREVVGSNPSRAIPKALKNDNSGHQALAPLLPKIFRTTNFATLTKKKSDNYQCLYSLEDRIEGWQSC